jgi:hypothetical protein
VQLFSEAVSYLHRIYSLLQRSTTFPSPAHSVSLIDTLAALLRQDESNEVEELGWTVATICIEKCESARAAVTQSGLETTLLSHLRTAPLSTITVAISHFFYMLAQKSNPDTIDPFIAAGAIPASLRLLSHENGTCVVYGMIALCNILMCSYGSFEDTGPHPLFHSSIVVGLEQVQLLLQHNPKWMPLCGKELTLALWVLYKNQAIPDRWNEFCQSSVRDLFQLPAVERAERLLLLRCIVTVQRLFLLCLYRVKAPLQRIIASFPPILFSAAWLL